MRAVRLPEGWRARAALILPAAALLALCLVWAAHDGGYDADTWYWGALALLAVLVATGLAGGLRVPPAPAARVALAAFTLYTGFSYLSIAWASAPGDALRGSNRCLLYLLAFALLCLLQMARRALLLLLVSLALGVGLIGLVLLVKLAAGHVAGGFPDGRLARPTGYFNATAALFTTQALLAVALGARRELNWLVRGCLLATATVSLQIALLCESRGWLFTLPLVLLAAVVVLRDRLPLAFWVLPPLAGLAAVISPSLHVFQAFNEHHPVAPGFVHAVERAGHSGLVSFVAVLVVGAGLAALATLRPPPELSPRRRQLAGAVVVAVVLAAAGAAILAGTHGDPGGFVSRQWHGFVHPPANPGNSGSHFGQVGSGRYDFWRVALHGFATHPAGGLGQDNFADFYVPRRHTLEEPQWVHSLPVRLLTHTGLIGALLFLGFLVAAVWAAWRARSAPAGWIAAIALLPLADWLIHGSLDWFWEMPALAVPALALLGAAAGAAVPPPLDPPTDEVRGAEATSLQFAAPPGRRRPILAGLAVTVAALAATVVLAFPYLAVRYTSRAADEQARNPVAALADLRTAARLDPLDPGAPRLAGAIALRDGLPNVAAERFGQATAREPGGWFGWFGAGLAASTLGEPAIARRDLVRAASINTRQPAIREALARVDSAHPLSPAEAFRLLVVVS